MSGKLSGFIFKKICGWKVEGKVPPEIKKFVIIAAPHTSNWDFFYGVLYFKMLHIPARFLIKKELFFFPLGWLLKSFGGVPVDRSKKSNQIESVANIIKTHDRLALLVTPEGTRKYNPKWKKGFYFIAQEAKVPIVLGYIDYENKIGGIGPVFYPTGDVKKDIEEIRSFYFGIKGKYPENGVY